MGISTGPRYKINGVVDTSKTVYQNLEKLCSAANSWLTYDIHTGLWSLVINRAGNSVASFGDHNILGSITVSSTGLTELYNSVRVEFPHIDLQDNLDYVTVTLPDGDRNINEPANQLSLQFDCINDPVQAEYIGYVELAQNRLDRAIKFSTDFSYLGRINAGDIIDVTNEVYGFENKTFRIVSLSEKDDGDTLILDIDAVEYDADIYDPDNLTRLIRTNSTGIATIGSIGQPGTPEITKYEISSRPRVLVDSTSPTGTVNGMEFWYSTQSDIVYDENRTYALMGTVRPAVGNTFSYGTTVSLEYSGTLEANGNIWVKTRGINSQTAGPFSTPGAFVYNPVQVTDAISNDTDVLDDNGDAITSMLGVSALLELLNGLFDGDTGIGSLFDQIAELNDQTGAISSGNTSGLWQGAARYVSSTEPTGTFNNGDVWFKVP